MTKSNVIRIFMFNIVNNLVCEATISYQQYELRNAVNYLEEYNHIHVKDIIVISGPTFFSKENDFFKDFYDTGSQNNLSPTYSLSLSAIDNVTKLTYRIQKYPLASVVILPNFENSKEIQTTFFNLPDVLTQEKLWLLLLSSNYSTTYEMIEDVTELLWRHTGHRLKFLLDSQIYLVANINDSSHLFEFYQSCESLKPSIKYLTSLQKDLSASIFIWENRKNLDGCELRVGYLEFAREVIRLSNNNLNEFKKFSKLARSDKMKIYNQGLALAGYAVQRFKILQSNLNFSMKLIHVDDEKVGSFDFETNEWNGIVGMLSRNEIDISLQELSITEERKSVISYATSSIHFKHYLYVLKPGPSVSWSHYTSVFDDYYWCVLALFVSLFTVISYFYLTSSRITKSDNTSNILQNSNIIHSLWQSVKAFIALDVNEPNVIPEKVKTSRRMMLLVMSFCGVLNFYVYNAMLISYLMAQKYETPIHELLDILINPKYKLTVLGGAADEDYLRYSSDSVYRNIWKKTSDEDGFFSNYNEANKRLFNGNNIVLFGESPSFDTTIDESRCLIVRSKIGYNHRDGAFAFQKNSPYTKLFSHYITKMMEKGLMVARIGNENEECKDGSNSFRALSYKDVVVTFPIFLLGCFLSLTYLMIENISKMLFRRR